MRIRWRGLELPSRVGSDRATLTDTYGKFTAEPFDVLCLQRWSSGDNKATLAFMLVEKDTVPVE